MMSRVKTLLSNNGLIKDVTFALACFSVIQPTTDAQYGMKHVVVIGNTGVGKSALCNFLSGNTGKFIQTFNMESSSRVAVTHR